MAKNPDLSVIIPLYNEAESLRELHKQLADVIAAIDIPAEFIFIDDGSTDGSFQTLKTLRRQDTRVKISQFRRNYGKSAALAEGFLRSRGLYVVTMDADLQDDPAEIPNLIQQLEQGFDVVSGWKKIRHDPISKKIGSKIFNFVTRILTGVHLHDMNCGLKIYRREVVKTVRVYGQRHRFIPVLATENGFSVGELVVQHRPRKFGRSKFGPTRAINGLLDLVTLLFLSRYVKRPLHLFGGFGLICASTGVLISLYLTIEKLFYAKFLSNRPLLFLGVLLIIVGVQSISIGLIGEMLAESRSDVRSYSLRTALGYDQPAGTRPDA